MCYMFRCEICGEVMEYEDSFAHARECNPELEKVEVTPTQPIIDKKKKVK